MERLFCIPFFLLSDGAIAIAVWLVSVDKIHNLHRPSFTMIFPYCVRRVEKEMLSQRYRDNPVPNQVGKPYQIDM